VARYTFGAVELSEEHESNFEQFVQFIKGRSIVSLADREPNVLELGLSGNVMVRISMHQAGGWPKSVSIFGSNEPGLVVSALSTQNPTEPPSFAFSLGDMPPTVPAWQLETKLRGLRTAFGIFYLANWESKVLTQYLRQHPYGDVDRLLGKDALQIESVSYGSWVSVLRSGGKKALDAIVAVATIVFPRTRDALLKKLEAEAELKDIEAKRGAVAVQRDEFELAKDRANYMVELVGKIEDAREKEIVHKRLRQAIYELSSGDTDEREIRMLARRLLPSGERGDDTER